MAKKGTQFDPVAAAAVSAINASQRNLTNVQSNLGAPELPGQAQVAQSATQGFEQVAQMSPFTVLAQSDLPNLPGMQGQFQLPGMQGQGIELPGMQGQGLPTPDSIFQSTPLPDPQQAFQQSPMPDPREAMPGQNGGNGGTSGGSNGGGGSASGSRDARSKRENYQRSR